MLSGVLSTVMTVSAVPIVSANAEESTEPYPYTIFAASSDEGAITVNAGNFCVNGNVATNGTIISNGNMNINGIRTESAEESMIFIFDKIDNQYFSASNVDEHDEDYILDEMNININVPTEVQGEATLTGNININNALKALEDVNLYGEVKNTNDSVIFSKYGDIVIDSQNVNLNGLVYAPFGSVTINAQNLNLNNVVIIAESIVLTCPSVNANNSSNASSFVGTTSEPLDIPYDEWQYMKDENENDFPDFFENYENWVLLKDTDGDYLPDCVEQFLETDATLADTDGDNLDDYYEVFVTGTDPVLPDTDNNGVADGDEDFDTDGLTNYQEYVQGTSPWNSDSDSDDLSDGDEVNTYGTNPLEPDTDFDGLSDADEVALGTNPNLFDTDGDGTPDGEEKFAQTYVYDVENKDCAVEQVIVSMKGTGNLQKNTSVESVMNKDIICSDVVGLIGEPFEIESESQFDTATITFKIDQTKLGNTELDNLLFLWYDEENYEFVEMETTHDAINSTVSITTTHFSRYMVVDKSQWYEAWAVEFNYNPAENNNHAPSFKYNTVLAIDCSGSMDSNDRISIKSGIDPAYEGLFPKTCQRIEAATEFIRNMNSIDKTAVVLFTSSASTAQSMTDNKEDLKLSLQNITSDGGTSFYAALTESYNAFEENTIGANYTNNRIILLSDGEDGSYSSTLSLLNSIYGINSTDKRKSIKIYTIGLGSSYDSKLEEIANISHGEFFKAYTADELVDIYSEIGIGGDFDTTDTDGDGLYDAVEAAGIRIQNGAIITGCNPTNPDSDNDGLKDGQEIDPTIRRKNIYLGSPEIISQCSGQYYFVMKSNPVNNDDTDNDGYSDIEDPDPLNKPEILAGVYDFLDDEIYTIEALDTFSKRDYLDIQGASADAGTSLIMYNYNGNDNQKFRFEWCGTGYKIHSLVNEELVLTMSLSSNGIGSLYMDYDYNKQDQIWEVLPYCNESKDFNWNCITGIIIRSKVLYYDENDNVGQPLYIHYTENSTFVSNDRADGTRFIFNNISKWMRFGKIYMNYDGWCIDEPYADVVKAMKNYKENLGNGVGKDNIFSYDSVDILLNQNQGEFPNLVYGDNVKMSNVICEVIATYNALKLKGIITDNPSYSKFFRLAVEFDFSAKKMTPPVGKYSSSGSFGSEPRKIGNCLDAYNVKYKKFDRNDEDTLFKREKTAAKEAAKSMDNNINFNDVLIMAYNFGTLDLQIHTFSGVMNNNGFIDLFNENCSTNISTSTTSVNDITNTSDELFRVGYILK